MGGGADRRVAGERQLAPRRKDPGPGAVNRITRLEQKHRLAQIELARDRLQLFGLEPVRRFDDRERIAAEALIGENVEPTVMQAARHDAFSALHLKEGDAIAEFDHLDDVPVCEAHEIGKLHDAAAACSAMPPFDAAAHRGPAAVDDHIGRRAPKLLEVDGDGLEDVDERVDAAVAPRIKNRGAVADEFADDILRAITAKKRGVGSRRREIAKLQQARRDFLATSIPDREDRATPRSCAEACRPHG